MKRTLPKTVISLGWVSFFMDIASEMVYPIMPLFLVGALGAPVIVLGIIEGFAEGLVSLLKGLSGYLSDRMQRRVPYVRWGYGLGALGKPLLACAFTWPLVFLARAVDRTGKGLRTTARDALIADTMEGTHVGRAFGFHRAMDTAGALIGVGAALVLMWLMPGHYRTIFLIATIPGVISVAFTFLIKETRTPPPIIAAETISPATATGACRFCKEYWLTLTALVIFALANSSDTFLLLRAKNVGLTDARVVLAYMLYNLTYTLSSYPAGIASDRIGRWKVISIGWLIYAIVYIGFALTARTEVWILFALYGVYIGFTQGVSSALIADYAPAERRGTALGIFHMSIGVAALVSSIFAGWLWDHVSSAAPFWFGGGAALVALGLLPFIARRSPAKKS